MPEVTSPGLLTLPQVEWSPTPGLPKQTSVFLVLLILTETPFPDEAGSVVPREEAKRIPETLVIQRGLGLRDNSDPTRSVPATQKPISSGINPPPEEKVREQTLSQPSGGAE